MGRSPRLFGAVLAALGLAINIPSSAGADWPTRPVVMVVPLAAGSGLDVFGRIIAPRMAQLLGQPVVIENVGGAGGMLGAARVAKAPPDGYQFLLGTVGTQAQNQALYKRPLYDAAVDFAPVALLAEHPLVLITRKDLPAANLQEFIAYVRAHHAEMQYGSSGIGSAAHLACALLNAAAGLGVLHVAYRGGGEAMQDLLSGRIDYQCPALSIARPHIEAEAVRPIAVLTKTRSPLLPSVATAQEQGLVEFEASLWYGIFLPSGTTPGVVQRLHKAAIATVETDDVRDRLRQTGTEVVTPERRSPEYLQTFVVDEIRKWSALIRAAGVTAE